MHGSQQFLSLSSREECSLTIQAPLKGALINTRACVNFRDTIWKQCLQMIAVCYEKLYSAVHDPTNEYSDPSSIMPRKPEQVSQLLQ